MLVVFRRLAASVLLAGVLASVPCLAQESPPPADAPPSNGAATNDRAAPVEVDPASLAALVKPLSPESRGKLGEMLAADWKDRPDWADMLIHLLQQQEMRPPFGWYRPSEQKFDYRWLSANLDANADGVVESGELPPATPDLDRVFARLDRDADGKLQPADFNYAGGQPAAMPQATSQFLFSLLDDDTNGRVTTEELSTFFSRAYKDKTGFLVAEDLYLTFANELAARNSQGEGMPGPEQMLAMFFRGELGVWEPGPALGHEAPDFTLPTHDGSRTVTLSQCRGKPVILIFGSFT
jgi:hypothetical protein